MTNDFAGDESKQSPPPPPAPPHSESVLLKQAPPLPVDVVCSSVERGIDTAGYCTVALFGFPFLEMMSEEEQVDTLQCSTIECHTIPVSKYLMVIEALSSIETIKGTRFSCAVF